MIVKEQGIIVQLMNEQSGVGNKTGNPWTSREFVIEIDDAGYKSNLHFKAFGRHTDTLAECKVGDVVEVSYKPQAREYNGRWYDENKLYGVTKVTRGGKMANPQPVDNDDDGKDDLPF